MKYVLRYAMASDLDLARVGALFPERERWGPFRVEGTLLAIGSSRSRIQSPGSLTLMSARPFVGGRIVKKPPLPGTAGTRLVTQVGDAVSAEHTEPPAASKDVNSSWWAPWQVIALVVVTVANYVWQVLYYLHLYGRFGITSGGLTVPLLLSFLWFLVATVLMVTRRRGGVPAMASFLVVEALFYLVHNVSGAAGRDLPGGDVVLLMASLLGYLNGFASVLFLVWLLLLRRRTSSGDQRPTRSH